MKARFMIGIYGSFRPEQVDRETRPGFYGTEVSCLPSLAEARRTAMYLGERHLRLGVHFPLVAGAHPGVVLHPFITSTVQADREAGFHALEQDLRHAAALGAEYLVTHIPKPAVIDPALDWSDWRSAQEDETILMGSTSTAEQEDLLASAFSRLSSLSSDSGTKVVLENDVLHAVHYGSLLPRLFSSHPGLGFCLDTGRARILERTDPGFDALRFTRTMLPYTTNVHLWTAQAGKNRQGGHHPVLPGLRAEDGWGETGSLLRALSAIPAAYVVFEHKADLITDEHLDECYRWVSGLLV